MNRLLVLLFVPLSAVASGPDDDSCADVWESFFALDHGAVVQCEQEEHVQSVVQEWVALDDAFDAPVAPGVAECEAVDVIERGGKAGETCTHYASATVCRSAANPHRVAIETGDGERVICPGE